MIDMPRQTRDKHETNRDKHETNTRQTRDKPRQTRDKLRAGIDMNRYLQLYSIRGSGRRSGNERRTGFVYSFGTLFRRFQMEMTLTLSSTLPFRYNAQSMNVCQLS